MLVDPQGQFRFIEDFTIIFICICPFQARGDFFMACAWYLHASHNNDYISYSNSDYSVTLEAIQDKLVKTHGGYFSNRKEGSRSVWNCKSKNDTQYHAGARQRMKKYISCGVFANPKMIATRC